MMFCQMLIAVRSFSTAAAGLAGAGTAAASFGRVLLKQDVKLPEIPVGVGNPYLVGDGEAAGRFGFLEVDLVAMLLQAVMKRIDVHRVLELHTEMPITPDGIGVLLEDEAELGVFEIEERQTRF